MSLNITSQLKVNNSCMSIAILIPLSLFLTVMICSHSHSAHIGDVSGWAQRDPDLLPWWLSGKEPTCNAGDGGLIPGSGRFPWRREWQPNMLAWKTPWTEELGGPLSMGLQKRRNLALNNSNNNDKTGVFHNPIPYWLIEQSQPRLKAGIMCQTAWHISLPSKSVSQSPP